MSLIRPRKSGADAVLRDWIARQNKIERYYAYLAATPDGSSAFDIGTSWAGGVSAVRQKDACLFSGFASRSDAQFELVYTGTRKRVFHLVCNGVCSCDTNDIEFYCAPACNGTTLTWAASTPALNTLADAPRPLIVNALVELQYGDLLSLHAKGDATAAMTFSRCNLCMVQVD